MSSIQKTQITLLKNLHKKMIKKETLLKDIDKYGYEYKLYNHKPMFTVSDSIAERGNIDGSHSKNLFLKNKKNEFFLFSCLENIKIELKKLSKSLNLGNISFAKDEYLYKYLGVLPGSVTPFGLINDLNLKVTFYLDSQFLDKKTVNFHPLVNTSTINMNIKDVINYLIKNKKKVNVFDFNNYSLLESWTLKE